MQRDLSPSSYLAEELGKHEADNSFDFMLKNDESLFGHFTDLNTNDTSGVLEVKDSETKTGGWRTIARNDTYCGVGDVLQLYLGTRKDRNSVSENVETNYFSSIKYELKQKATGNFSNAPVLMSQLQVVDPVTGEEIRKNNKTILKGSSDATLERRVSGDTPTYENTIQFKFTDVSYHHDRKPFALRVSLFRHESTDEPILVKQSEPIMVFARKKPALLSSSCSNTVEDVEQKNNKRKKRKKSEEVIEEETTQCYSEDSAPPLKKANNFELFKEKLEGVFEQMKKLSKEERERAFKEILSKMYYFDSNAGSCYVQQMLPSVSSDPFRLL